MAAEVNARQNKQPTLAFTLPISCQVCLGKVKNPVLCPNNHVFCSTCMDVWLQKTKQCPACRVTMTSSKKILGGLSQHEESDSDKLSNPDLRKARFDLLYKEYENEFERMHSELQLLKTENQILKQQVKRDGGSDSRSGESSRAADNNNLLLLTKKLQDATKLYEKVKGELGRLKQENSNLKDENVGLNRENQHLRGELTGRSPHRFGRTTVATLETKLASAEKDIARLTKAMERSDKYIEELEAELQDYRGTTSSGKPAASKPDKYLTNGDIGTRRVYSDSKVSQFSSQRSGADNSSRRQLFSEDRNSNSATGEKSKYYYDGSSDSKSSRDLRDEYTEYTNDRSSGNTQSAKTSVPNNGKKRVTFDMEKNTLATTSFDLELPSPLKASNRNAATNGRSSPVKGVLKKTGGKGNADDKSMDSYTDLSRTAEDSDTFTSKYTSRQSKDDDLLYLRNRSQSRDRDYESEDLYSSSKPRKKYSADDSFLSEPSSMEVKSLSDLEYGTRRSGDKRAGDYDRKSGSDYDARRRDVLRGRNDDDELSREDLEDTQYIESELDELNISLTPEFTDCMKLLNRAEKKVHTHDTSDDEEPLSRYKSSQDKDYDSAFRASTGSIGYKPGVSEDLRASTGSYGYKTGTGATEDLLSSYKPDQAANRFGSSLDSYSRGRHVRTGSLDNIYIEKPSGLTDRPGSALPSTSNMYTSAQNKYSSGLTTGRTTLTRTPSLDNLLMSRPGATVSRASLQGFPGVRSYRGENEDKLDVNANLNTGAGSTAAQKPLTALHGYMGGTEAGGDRPRDDMFDAVLQARARSLSDTGKPDLDRKLPPTGRLTPTLQSMGASGRVTPTLPSQSDYLALPKSTVDKYSTGSGRTTPTLTSTSNYDALTKTNTQFSEYKTSGLGDMSMKPPSGVRQQDVPSTFSSYLTSSTSSYTNTAPGKGYTSLPMYNSTTSGGGGDGNFDNKFDSGPMSAPYGETRYSDPSKSDFDLDKYNVGARASSVGSSSSSSQPVYNSDNKLTSLKGYSDRNFMDADFTNYSSKSSSASNHLSSVPSSTNASSALFTGPSSSSSASSLGLGSAYSGSSYLPGAMSAVPAGSSYSTALSVPLTLTTSSYTSSVPSNTYTSNTLDPIAESNHFSYVSNASGDFSSKNDTFGLPEPKKRLFEDSGDLNLSVSPIKSNRRF